MPTADAIEEKHTLGLREGKIPPIIVRFRDCAVHDRWAAKRIFVDENLTRPLRQLLGSTKQRAREKCYKFVWVKNGKILFRQNKHGATICFENDGDLLKSRNE